MLESFVGWLLWPLGVATRQNLFEEEDVGQIETRQATCRYMQRKAYQGCDFCSPLNTPIEKR